MIRSLKERYNYIELQRAKQIDYISQLRPEQLHFRPSQDRWSLLQVMEHLVLVEALMGQQASERLRAAVTDERIPWKSHIAFLLAAVVLPLPFRITAPDRTLPTRGWDLPEVIESWEQTRKEWRELLEIVPPNRLAYPAVNHPILGWFSLSQTLRFFAMHFDHHMLQMGRIQRDRGYPR